MNYGTPRLTNAPMNDQPTQPGKPEKWESPRGSLLITQPVPGVMVFTYEGYMVADVVPFIERAVNAVLATGLRPDLFIDLENMTGYDTRYRQDVSKWGSTYYKRFGESYFLVRSKLIAMGIAISNLTSEGHLKSTTRRSEYQAALEAAIARHAAT
jgi:hypothetical protein